MDLSFLTGLIIGLLTHFAPFYLPRLLPFRPAPGQVRWGVAQYERLYAGYHTLAICYAAALTIGLGAAWDFVLRILRVFAHPELAAPDLLLATSEGLWIMMALIAGYACAIPASQGFLRIILRHRYSDYLIYRSLRAGYSKQLSDRVLSALLLSTAVAFSYHYATTYTAFTVDHVEIRRTFRPALVYDYHDIAEIRGERGRVTINGKTEDYENGVYVIEFTDGYQWHMRQAGAANNSCRGYRAVALAAARSGQEITGPDLRARCR